jgi:predicted permease
MLPTTIRVWLVRVLAVFSGRRCERDFDDEIHAHIDLLASEYERSGMSPTDARYAARRAFGAVEPMKEVYRDRQTLRWMDDLGRDVRYALRGLKRSPGFASVAVLTLALGIGANTAIFSLVDAVLLKSLPVRHARDLVLPGYVIDGRHQRPFAAYQFRALRSTRDVLTDLAAFRPLPMTVTYRGETIIASGQLVSGGYHGLLGVDAVIGRTLTEIDDFTSADVAVLGYGYWQRRFGGATSVIGESIEVNGHPVTIVGVTARGFSGTEAGRVVDVTVPLSKQPGVFGARFLLDDATEARWLYLIGRLASGVPRAQAEAALAVAWNRAYASRPASRRPPAAPPFELLAGSQGLNQLREQFAMPLRLLMAMVMIVLVIACANLATLLLARSGARRQEMSVRLAIGASRGRLVRQLLTESVLLSGIGGTLGVGLACLAGDALVQMMSRGAPLAIALDLSLNWRTLLFTALASLTAGIVFGLAPAFRAWHVGAITAVRTTVAAGMSSRWSHGLIAMQVTLCVVLLVEAGLFTRSLMALRGVDAGFTDAHSLVLADVRTRANDSSNLVTRQIALFKELSVRDRALRARSVSFSMDMPLAGGSSFSQNIEVPGRVREANEPGVSFNFVGPRFLETMGIAVEGRDIRADDKEGSSPVAVISRSLAKHYFPGESAIGKHIRTGKEDVEIVGVAADVKYATLRDLPTEMIYLPFLQSRSAAGVGLVTIAVRAMGGANETETALKEQMRLIAPDLMVARLSTLDERRDGTLARERIVSVLSICFGTLALLLGSIGLYGTLSCAVARRIGEIGVRVALGAQRSRLMTMVVGESVRPVVVGIALGLPLAFGAARFSERLLFGIRAGDPAAFMFTIVVLLGSACCASILPARRAASVDPVVALRAE